MATNEGALHLV